MDKILVIDDSAVQAEFLRSILRDEYDVSICHIMPDMDGFTALRELKATELTKHIPVILLTSLADEQYEERGLLMGAVDYVAKPFSPVIIRARVSTHIHLYHDPVRPALLRVHV